MRIFHDSRDLFYRMPLGAGACGEFVRLRVRAEGAVSVSLRLWWEDREILRDSLTGLNNRKAVGNIFPNYIRQLTPDTELYMFMMDLDNFKKINDTYGHPEGDHALITAARLFLKAIEGKRCMLARMGGDEFAILGFFPDQDTALAFKNHITSVFEDFNLEKSLPYTLGVSVGCSAASPGQTLAQLTADADKKLYQAKKEKKRAI